MVSVYNLYLAILPCNTHKRDLHNQFQERALQLPSHLPRVLHGFRITRTARLAQSEFAGLRTPFPATVGGQAVVAMM